MPPDQSPPPNDISVPVAAAAADRGFRNSVADCRDPPFRRHGGRGLPRGRARRRRSGARGNVDGRPFADRRWRDLRRDTRGVFRRPLDQELHLPVSRHALRGGRRAVFRLYPRWRPGPVRRSQSRDPGRGRLRGFSPGPPGRPLAGTPGHDVTWTYRESAAGRIFIAHPRRAGGGRDRARAGWRSVAGGGSQLSRDLRCRRRPGFRARLEHHEGTRRQRQGVRCLRLHTRGIPADQDR